MPDTITGLTSGPVTATAPVSATAAGVVADANAEHGGHHYDFAAINTGHNFPSPVIEWIHGKPLLILNTARYAQVNYKYLSSEAGFAQAATTASIQDWANAHAAKSGYVGPDAGNLAKAMVVAETHAVAMPRPLSFFTHQTFWSTVALLIGAFILLVVARRKPDQVQPRGRLQNALEALVLFVRDDIVRPNFSGHADHSHGAAGSHGAADTHAQPAHAAVAVAKSGDAWTPFFAALFLTLLTCNLFGLVPLFGTATGDFAVTLVWGLIIGGLMLTMALLKNGPAYFIKQVPIPFKADPITLVLWPFLFVIETLQLIIRPLALAIRLFANMLAGHIVLLVFASLGFIVYAANSDNLIMPSALGIAGWLLTIGFYAFELLVAFLQAYIFTLLSAVFVSLCAHPEH